jgi:hypothetical protein
LEVSSNFKAYLEENGIKVPDMWIPKNNNNSVIGILQKTIGLLLVVV